MHLYKKSGFLALLFFITLCAQAQKTPSFYSSFGVGEQYGTPYLANRGMGGSGLANINPTYMNLINPASMVFTELTSFEAGLFIESKTYRTVNQNENRSNGSLGYLALGVPIINGRWNVSANIMPYSFMSYNNVREIEDPNFITPIRKSFTGDGALTRASFSNSVKLFKGFAVGLSAHYYFGQINRAENTDLGDYILINDTVRSIYTSSLIEQTNYSDFGLSTSVFYSLKLKNKNYINFAASYELPTQLSGTKSISLGKYNLEGNPISIGLDTSNVSVIMPETKGNTFLPAKYGGGFTYGKINKYSISADGYFQDWSSFSDFESSPTNMGASYSVHLGTEFVPDFTSLESYMARVTYRAGGHFQKAAFSVNGNDVYNFGINFGASFPLRAFSSFNTALEIGQMGSVQNGLVAESYFRLHLGISVLDRWFVRQKFD